MAGIDTQDELGRTVKPFAKLRTHRSATSTDMMLNMQRDSSQVSVPGDGDGFDLASNALSDGGAWSERHNRVGAFRKC